MLSKHLACFYRNKNNIKTLWCTYRGLNTNKGTGNRKWVALGQGHLFQDGRRTF